MENNFFIYTDKTDKVKIERFHICAWEFKNNSAIIEFGGEINNTKDLIKDQIVLFLHIPWVKKGDSVTDLFEKLKEPENSKFIFNESVVCSRYVNHDQTKYGVILDFYEKESLCIMPIESIVEDEVVIIKIKTAYFNEHYPEKNINIYFRFYLEPNINCLSTRKLGINKTSIIYDIKVNEKRNLPDTINIGEINLCKIQKCFLLNILPNSFDMSFLDVNHLKSVRTLEYQSFRRYLGDSRVMKDELMVVFNKNENSESYSFFTRYLKERIGAGQFALAVLGNLLCGILLYLPSFRINNSFPLFSKQMFQSLPPEVYLSALIGFLIIIYFIWPIIIKISKTVISFFRRSK